MASRDTHKGYFKPKNPAKYRGNKNSIFYRSSWELKFMKWLDLSDNVIEWSSEELAIPYKHPGDGQYHRYFPDFMAKLRTMNGNETYIIEIKPFNQTVPPKPRKRKTKGYLQEIMTFAVNDRKFEAARAYCKNHGYQFEILTEKKLAITG